MRELTSEERLKMQQLRLRDYWSARAVGAEIEASGPATANQSLDLPQQWRLTGGLTLAPWQREAVDAWFSAGGRGTIKVVTGAGKTVAALAVAERLQRDVPQLRVVIVVPTIVLMQQWHEVLVSRSNLPPTAIGRLGGGHSDDFDAQKRVLVAVLSSARKSLPTMVRKSAVGDRLLFVADECHRLGAPEMSAVLETPRRFSLGLSATPERDDDPSGAAMDADSDREIGDVVYEMSFAQAIEQGVLPPFDVQHFGLSLSADEARQYQALTHSINDARRELIAAAPPSQRQNLMAWARRSAKRRVGDQGEVAARFVAETTRRKQLLYRAGSRLDAAQELVLSALRERADARVILFHESIEEVGVLFDRLGSADVPVVMEHSELPQELRDRSLELFRAGDAKVIVSARSLIEGFDVPEADLGIIVASTSSPRQRIQSIGRVLRKHRDGDGADKSSRICVLFVRGTVDEAIYEREDWGKLVGVDRNRYFAWDLPAQPVELPGPPRNPLPSEVEIDFGQLREGDAYPGQYEGDEYSATSAGNVHDADGRVAANPQKVPAIVTRLKGQAGRFRVTRQARAILVLARDSDGSWGTIYGGLLAEAFSFRDAADQIIDVDVMGIQPGDAYPGPVEPAEEFRFRQRAGGVIAKRVPRGEVFALGPAAEQLLIEVRHLAKTRNTLSRVLVNRLRHAFWFENGEPRFITALDEDLTFPEMP
ncbi:DEAD/DEAH box helicase [Dactylosporangium sp. NPDC050588]|uniref:DEAD/DEAH box helicase n=1 Tax=Dactylosporangium sp. NPDC050588 TaxID=3157211 RepID=UPI0033F23D9B